MMPSKEFKMYFIFFIVLLAMSVSYKYVFNRHGRIEHYYYEKDRTKYTVLTYMVRIMNVVLVVYSRYIFMELIKLLYSNYKK